MRYEGVVDGIGNTTIIQVSVVVEFMFVVQWLGVVFVGVWRGVFVDQVCIIVVYVIIE